MPYAIELSLDESADRQIREIWAALDLSSRLLTLHDAVHNAIEPLVDGIWPYYRPDSLLPHCTLAIGVTDKARAVDIVSRFAMPIPAVVAGAQLVEVPGGHHRIQLSPD